MVSGLLEATQMVFGDEVSSCAVRLRQRYLRPVPHALAAPSETIDVACSVFSTIVLAERIVGRIDVEIEENKSSDHSKTL